MVIRQGRSPTTNGAHPNNIFLADAMNLDNAIFFYFISAARNKKDGLKLTVFGD
jgi:hypothetical protein